MLQEAQMAGLPVISTLHAGIPEVVIDGTTGFLCQEGDVQAMASAIETLLAQPGSSRGDGSGGTASCQNSLYY